MVPVVTLLALHTLHKLVVGIVANVLPSAHPHTPFTGQSAFAKIHKLDTVPPLVPSHFHFAVVPQVLVLFVQLTVPAVHHPLTILLHIPFILTFALQLAEVHHPIPLQLHVHGQEPLTGVGFQTLQSHVAGGIAKF